MKISVENGKIYNQMTMGERLERIGEVLIVDAMDCIRLDFIKKMESNLMQSVSSRCVVDWMKKMGLNKFHQQTRICWMM